MKSIRNLGSALIYAVLSLVFVVGGLSLALAEGRVNLGAPTAKASPTLYLPSATATEVTPTEIVVPTIAPSDTAQAIIVTATQLAQPLPSSTASPRPLATSTRVYDATAVRCGPYVGWLKNYIVKQGDTLFHIATLYQTTVQALQTANCLPGYTIYPGQVLWVPNVPTITPSASPTLTPFTSYSTATPTPTLPLTLTPIPTDTPVPTLPLTATPLTPVP